MEYADEPVPLYRPPIRDNARQALMRCFDSGWWGYGPESQSLEAKFTAIHQGWALATSSCTSALYIAARLVFEPARDEVVVPAITWVSTAIAFIQAGFRVRLADVDPANLLATPDSIARQVTPRTRAVVAVHLYGQQPALSTIRELCDRRGLLLIEDNAHNLSLSEPPLSDLRCYSFNVLKEIPGGEGGLLWGREPAWRSLAKQIAYLGMERDTLERAAETCHSNLVFGQVPGLKLKMNDLTASIVNAMFAHQEDHRASRERIFAYYDEHLGRLDSSIQLLHRSKEDSRLMYVIRLSGSESRLSFRQSLAEAGIATSIHYPSLSKHPLVHAPDTPVADQHAERIVTLPCYPDLREEAQARLVKVIEKTLQYVS